jgi:hypothetical protein
VDLLPGVRERLDQFRKDSRLPPRMEVVEASHGPPEKKGNLVEAIQVVSHVAETREGEEEIEVKRMDPIDAPRVVPPEELEPNPRSNIVSYTRGGSPESKVYGRIPTFKTTLWNVFLTRARPVPRPRYSIGGDRSRELIELEDEVKLTGATLYTTPVLPVSRVADMFGRSEESVERTARELGLYVIGKGYRLITKVPLELSREGPAVQQETQRKANVERAKVLTSDSPQVMAVLAHKLPARAPKISVVEEGPFPVFNTRGVFQENDPMSSLNSLMQKNGYLPIIKNRNVQVGKEQRTRTKLMWAKAGVFGREQGTQTNWLATTGVSSKENARNLCEYVGRVTGMFDRKDEIPLVAPTWSELVEEEERARFRTARGVEFQVRKQYLVPGPDFSPTEDYIEDQGLVYIAGTLWKQRAKETLAGFCKRTQKFLHSRGVEVEYQAPKSVPNIIPPPTQFR